MLDKKANEILKNILIPISRILLKLNIKPDHITFFGLFVGFCSFVFLSFGMTNIALILFLINRILDGIDGTMARLSKKTDLGGYYDIVCDFFIYAIIPFGFILLDKENCLSMAFLLTTFLGTCSTFLTTAWIFEKNKIKIDIKTTNPKSFYYSVGLIEGTETILFFVLMFLFYEFAYLLAWILSFLCIITSLLRVLNVKFVLNAKK